MDALFRWIDSLKQSVAWQTILSHFAVWDWVVVLVVLWGALYGSRKGFAEMWGKFFGMVVIIIMTMSLYESVSRQWTAVVPAISKSVAEPMSFVMVTVFVWIPIVWLLNMMDKFVHLEVRGALKFFGGMFFGGLYMVLLLSLVVQFLLMLPLGPVKDTLSKGGSLSGYTLSRIAPEITNAIAKPILRLSGKTVYVEK